MSINLPMGVDELQMKGSSLQDSPLVDETRKTKDNNVYVAIIAIVIL